MVQREIQEVDEGEDFVHVRFRDPDTFETIRTPDWAAEAADSVSSGAKVRMGQHEDSDGWSVQSILVKKKVGTEKARDQATEIVEKIQEE